MEGIILLSIIYWIATAVIFIVGLVKLISLSTKNEPVKPGLKLMIGAVIMLVIGIGACAAILSGIGG